MISILKPLVCKFKGHELVYAGTCPYTGSVYDVCDYCLTTIPRQEAV
jgi:hypothetical protein